MFTDFFLEKIHMLVWIFLWIFGCFKSVSSMLCLNYLLLILKLTDDVLSKATYLGKHICT